MAGSKFLFSERFNVKRKGKDDWYDVLLQTDTKLFVDPFRIYDDDAGVWRGAHAELVDFFNLVLELMAKASLNPQSSHWKAAAKLLMFPEPVEFCLGYAKEAKGGQGTAKKTRDGMLKAGSLAIKAGLDHVNHFEEMALFQGRIGPDLVSDIVCNVLKGRFIKYTQSVCKRHKSIKTKSIPVKHISWNRKGRRWENGLARLPYNPWTNSAILLVPESFLRELPTIEGDDFWEYAFAHEVENIKGDFEYDVARNVDSDTIAKLARRNPELVKKYVGRYEKQIPSAYDIAVDPRGLVNWYRAGKDLGAKIEPVSQPQTQAAFATSWKSCVKSLYGQPSSAEAGGFYGIRTARRARSPQFGSFFTLPCWATARAMTLTYIQRRPRGVDRLTSSSAKDGRGALSSRSSSSTTPSSGMASRLN